MSNSADIAFYEAQLKQHRESLRQLRGQVAAFAEGEKRVYQLNQILDLETNIREAKAKLRQLGVEPAPSAIDPPERFQPFPEHIIKQYPYPLAQPCAHFNQQDNVRDQFTALDRLIVHLIKYLAAIFISQTCRDQLLEYPIPNKLEWIVNPTLESWTEAISELSQIYCQSPYHEKWLLNDLLCMITRSCLGNQAIREAIDYLTLQLDETRLNEPSIVDFLQLLAWYCRQNWEGAAGNYPAEKVQPLMWHLQPALIAVLNELEPLRRYPLIYLEWAKISATEVRLRLVKFMGLFTTTVSPAHKPALILPLDKEIPITTEQFYHYF